MFLYLRNLILLSLSNIFYSHGGWVNLFLISRLGGRQASPISTAFAFVIVHVVQCYGRLPLLCLIPLLVIKNPVWMRVSSPCLMCKRKYFSTKIKILGVFFGDRHLSDDNWHPRLDVVSRCLNSWHSCVLSFAGRALVVNALEFSRVWYITSLIHMPEWVRTEVRRTVFSFIWAGKQELVARRVMYHPKCRGGFSVISVDLKIAALLIQWVRRLSVCPNGWVSLLKYWLLDRQGVSPNDFYANPSIFSFPRFPPSYTVSSVSCKSTYQALFSLHPAVPHCVCKFHPSFGALDWPTKWRSLFFLPQDHQVCDLNWKIAHGVLETAESLSSFGLSVPLACFCGYQTESLKHLFFSCPLVPSGYAWVQTCPIPLSYALFSLPFFII